MARRDKSEEGVLDATEVGLVATGAFLGGPVGAGLGVLGVLANKAGKVLCLAHEARVTRFLTRVIHYLEEQDPDGAAEFVATHAETPEFAGAVERGFEAMRRTFDPAAEECVCLLTADHALRGRPIDRRFAKAAALLEECDLSMLLAIESITRAYVSAVKDATETSGMRVLFDRPEKEAPASFFVVAYSGSTVVGMSEEILSPSNLRRALAHLARHDFGLVWRGGGTLPPEGKRHGATPSSVHHFVANDDDERMVDLHRYLAPVRRQ